MEVGMHQSDNRDIAVLQEQMGTVKSDVTEIKGDVKEIIKTLEDTYVKKSEFQQFKWIAVPGTIIVTAVITSLVYFFFTNRVPAKPTTNAPTTTTSSTTTASSTSTPSASTSAQAAPTSTTPASNSSTPGASVTVPLPSLSK